MKDYVGRTFEVVGMALSALSERRTTAKHRATFKIPIKVPCDEQIKATISIVVEPARTGGPAFVDFRKLVGDIAKGTISVISVEAIRLVPGDK
jgi:hypothetical protein